MRSAEMMDDSWLPQKSSNNSGILSILQQKWVVSSNKNGGILQQKWWITPTKIVVSSNHGGLLQESWV